MSLEAAVDDTPPPAKKRNGEERKHSKYFERFISLIFGDRLCLISCSNVACGKIRAIKINR